MKWVCSVSFLREVHCAMLFINRKSSCQSLRWHFQTLLLVVMFYCLLCFIQKPCGFHQIQHVWPQTNPNNEGHPFASGDRRAYQEVVGEGVSERDNKRVETKNCSQDRLSWEKGPQWKRCWCFTGWLQTFWTLEPFPLLTIGHPQVSEEHTLRNSMPNAVEIVKKAQVKSWFFYPYTFSILTCTLSTILP